MTIFHVEPDPLAVLGLEKFGISLNDIPPESHNNLLQRVTALLLLVIELPSNDAALLIKELTTVIDGIK